MLRLCNRFRVDRGSDPGEENLLWDREFTWIFGIQGLRDSAQF